jgi:hypothetical protein
MKFWSLLNPGEGFRITKLTLTGPGTLSGFRQGGLVSVPPMAIGADNVQI